MNMDVFLGLLVYKMIVLVLVRPRYQIWYEPIVFVAISYGKLYNMNGNGVPHVRCIFSWMYKVTMDRMCRIIC